MSCVSALFVSTSSRTVPIAHVAQDLGIHKEALRQWVRQAEADNGRRRDLLTSEERKRLRKEISGLRRANAILRHPAAPPHSGSPSPGRVEL